MRKPFDAFAEGPFLKNSRGDKTVIELFTEGVRSFPAIGCLAAKAFATNSECFSK
jgi:hypothetical protein